MRRRPRALMSSKPFSHSQERPSLASCTRAISIHPLPHAHTNTHPRACTHTFHPPACTKITHARAHIHAHTHARARTPARAETRMHAHTRARRHARTPAHTHEHTGRSRLRVACAWRLGLGARRRRHVERARRHGLRVDLQCRVLCAHMDSMHTHTNAHRPKHTRTHTYTHARTHAHAQTHKHTRTRTKRAHAHMHARTHARTHTRLAGSRIA